MELSEPESEGDVVGGVEAVPEGADHEDVYLADGFVFEAVALVDAFSQPFLDRNVPVVYFLADVDGSFNHVGVHSIDAFEVFAAVAHPRGVHCAHAQLPSEVVAAAGEAAGHEDVPEDVPEPVLDKLFVAHPGEREVDLSGNIHNPEE